MDLWSVGIISYILLAGRHPLFKEGDTLESYWQRLKGAQWEFPREFTDLAKEFFLKLVRVNPLERYTAQEALQHPWITRVPGAVPLSYSESIRRENDKDRLLNVNDC